MGKNQRSSLMTTYDIPHDEWVCILEQVIDRDLLKPHQVLGIPGVYEILSEHYNNEVLSDWVELHSGGRFNFTAAETGDVAMETHDERTGF